MQYGLGKEFCDQGEIRGCWVSTLSSFEAAKVAALKLSETNPEKEEGCGAFVVAISTANPYVGATVMQAKNGREVLLPWGEVDHRVLEKLEEAGLLLPNFDGIGRATSAPYISADAALSAAKLINSAAIMAWVYQVPAYAGMYFVQLGGSSLFRDDASFVEALQQSNR
jgi:hypothetical protein